MKNIKQQIEKKGFCHFFEKDGINLIDLNNFTLLNVEERNRDNGQKDLPKELNHRLSIFSNYLKTKYIDIVWPNNKFLKFTVWDGVDKDNQGWHTDMFEDYDVFFLYYYDDSEEKTGGSIQFKWKEKGEFKIYSHQPKSGDLFLVSNARGFWHRAESTTIQRRVMSFDFLLDND
jgi:hypothetical protein